MLKVNEIFYSIQGEGPYVGRAAVFVRLSGCNLKCTFCDTDAKHYKQMQDEVVFQEVVKQAGRYCRLVVITGGEPLEQNIQNLCNLFLTHGFIVQLETNGTIWQPIPKNVHIVCSPKATESGFIQLNEKVLKQTIALKFLISVNYEQYLNIQEVGQTKYNIPVYVQPMDEKDSQKNYQNLQKAIEITKSGKAYLSVQLHKLLNLS